MKQLHIKQHAKRLNRQAGITLVEIGVSLAILAAVVAGSLALFTATSTSQKVQQVNQDLTAIRGAVQQLHVQAGTYGTTDLTDLIKAAGRLPSTLRIDGSDITHGLNEDGNGTISATGIGRQFYVSVDGLSPEACLLLASQASGWVIILNAKPTAVQVQTDQTVDDFNSMCTAARTSLHFVST
jgi:type II secretory pathway pseudopilin PulG